MASTLQEQLLKAGLVDPRQLSSVNKEKRKQEKMQRKHKVQAVDEIKLSAEQARQEKAERDRQLNLERDNAARRKAIIAQIRQLIETSRLDRGTAELPYNFTDGTRIKKIYVTREILDQLSNGRLAIVKFEDRYDVVPKSVADKIRERDQNYVVVSNRLLESEDPDDPYAEYKIPDDLMW